MSEANTHVDSIEKHLREALDARMSAGRSLAQRAADVSAARTSLESAERAYSEAFAAAEDAGWTSAELRKALKGAGIAMPAVAPRRRRSSTGRRSDAQGVSAPEAQLDAPAS